MKRRNVLVMATLASITALVIPVLVAGWIAHDEAVDDARNSLQRRADALANSTSTVMTDVARGLRDLDAVPLECTAPVIQRLRELVFDVPEIAETGLMSPTGELVCTSWGAPEKPLTFDIEPIPGDMSLKGPVIGRMIGRYVLVAERERPTGGFSNALIQPRTLIGLAAGEVNRTGFAALFSRSQSRPIVSVGLLPELAAPFGEQPVNPAMFDDGLERIVASAPVAGYPDLVTVAAESRRAIVGSQWRSTSLIIGVGIATALALVGLVLWFARRRLSLQGELERAVHDRRLRVRYQPVVDIDTGRCVGVEALLRWHNRTHGEIRPDQFVPIAEDTGLIDDITRMMIERVVGELAPILRENPHMHVAVNVWPEHVRSDWILPFIETTMASGGLYAGQLVFEFAERTFTSADGPGTREVLDSLSRMGVGLAMDDFGAGYSTMAHLRELKLSYIKIDRHFVAAIGADAVTSNLVDAIVDIADRLEVRVIAEGVENPDQRDYLRRRGVHNMQGFYYARPLSLRQLRQFLDEFESTWDPTSA
ncbi:MAG: EAL domain-containing protein, partial [Pseudomonadota bacterium]